MVHGNNFTARVADDNDGLRQLLQTARSWHVAPHLFMGEPAVTTYLYNDAGRLARTETVQWTEEDRAAALALAEYEASLCPGCGHPLEETTKAEHQDAYRPEPAIRCHYCTSQAIVDKARDEDSAGLLIPITLHPDVVELNLKPIPPMPPELAG